MELGLLGALTLVATIVAIWGGMAIADRLVPPERPAGLRVLVRIVAMLALLALIGASLVGLAVLFAPLLEPFF